jgi:hypothetical protein
MSYDLNLILVDRDRLEAKLIQSESKPISFENVKRLEVSLQERARLLQCLMNDMPLHFPPLDWDKSETDTIELIYENADKAFGLFVFNGSIAIRILSIDDALFDA